MSLHPALRLLARRKLRGVLRTQARRLKTLKGGILGLLGFGLFAVWLVAIVGHSFVDRVDEGLDPERGQGLLRVLLLSVTLLSLSGAFVHRGLFLPREEIERLFGAPISRSELVRYRLLSNFGRTTFGAVVSGLLVLRWMPEPGFAFLGTFVTVQTIPVLNQLLAIAAGVLEVRMVKRLGLLRRIFGPLLAVVAIGAILLASTGESVGDLPLLRRFAMTDGDPLEHPVLLAVTAPLTPWANMIAAESWGEFLPGFGFALLFLFALVELTARLPVDYRELSLETSASVAARLRRMGRGGAAANAKVGKRTVGWRIPWLFGRGALGAIAWGKTVAIVRKAKGALWISALVLVFVVILSLLVARNAPPWAGPAVVAVVGTLYLCAGLRFDFRDELDRMSVIKTWPLSSAGIFAAMLGPEVVVISSLLIVAVCTHMALVGSTHVAVLPILATVPLVVFAWVALDNAVYLLAPVRFVRGQEGALQNAGRGVIVLFLRLLLLMVAAAVGGVAGAGGYFLADGLGLGESGQILCTGAGVWLALFVVDAALLGFGGFVLRRFDVARDRG